MRLLKTPKSYQENNNLSITGELDLSTEMHLIDYYRTLLKIVVMIIN